LLPLKPRVGGSEIEIAVPGAIDKRENPVFADTFDVAVHPRFGGKRFLLAFGSMRFDLIRRTEHDVHVPAIGSPAGAARRR